MTAGYAATALAGVLGILGGATYQAIADLVRRRGRHVVPLEPGTRIAEPDGREWQIVGRRFDMRVGQVPTLTVDLGLRSDPS